MQKNSFVFHGKKGLLIRLIAHVLLWIPVTTGAGHGHPAVAEPFKVGTFEIKDEARVGIVLRDRLVVDLNDANKALEKNSFYPTIPIPTTKIFSSTSSLEVSAIISCPG